MAALTPTGAPINVLVVDDESNIRKTLAVCLETDGHRVVAVGNFQDAVSESSRRSFDLASILCVSDEVGVDCKDRTGSAAPAPTGERNCS